MTLDSKLARMLKRQTTLKAKRGGAAGLSSGVENTRHPQLRK
jgi:hypothetical protein